MAAILNGFLPGRKKESFAHDRMLNARWGDTAISAPMHGGWAANSPSVTELQESPDLDRDLPPTPPQYHEEESGVFIVHDEDEHEHNDLDTTATNDRDNITITIPLPWKKKHKGSSHGRKLSGASVLNPRFAPPKRLDGLQYFPTTEVTAVPLSENPSASPITRSTATSPVMSFRSRLCSPNMGDILSPVVEGFAKSGPSSRPALTHSQISFTEEETVDRPSTASSMRSVGSHRVALHAYGADGIGFGTMSSQATTEEQTTEMHRPPSRGIGATAQMRASSRGPRASSRGPRAASVEPFARRAPSREPVNNFTETSPAEASFVHQNVLDFEPLRRRAPSVEPARRRAPSVEPVSRRAPSVEPYQQRSPSVDPVFRRAPLAEPVARRAPSVEPISRRAPSVEPMSRRAPSVEPVSRRAPSVEPVSRRAPSIGPVPNGVPSAEPIATRRARSREARGRRGKSTDPAPRVRFLSEAPPNSRRPSSFSSNDGSVDSYDDTEAPSEPESYAKMFLPDKDFTTSRKVRRRRSIASPMTSPTMASFGITAVAPPPMFAANFDTISSRVGLVQEAQPPVVKRNPPRNRSKSRTRGLYADLQDDYRLLAREVQKNNVVTKKAVTDNVYTPTTESLCQSNTATVTTPTTTCTCTPTAPNLPSTVKQTHHNVLNQSTHRAPSPALTSNPPTSFASIGGTMAPRFEPERTGYSSDASLPSRHPLSNNALEHYTDTAGGKALLTAMHRERMEQLRREERERARERVARKLSHEMEQDTAVSVFSDTESLTSGYYSGSEYGTRFFSGGVASESEYDTDRRTSGRKPYTSGKKTLVPDAEDIWG